MIRQGMIMIFIEILFLKHVACFQTQANGFEKMKESQKKKEGREEGQVGS